jgi:hypothetical protein
VEVLDDADDLEAVADLDDVLDDVLEVALVPAIKYKF